MLNDRLGPEVGIERTSGSVSEICWSGLEATTSKNSARAEPMFLSDAKPASSAALISAAVSRNILSL